MIFINSFSNGLAFPQKVNLELPYELTIQLLSIVHLKRLNTGKHIFTPTFIATLFTITKRWEEFP